jgi:hypothetical protein
VERGVEQRRGRFVWTEPPEEPGPPRCPRCGVGDLLRARLQRGPGRESTFDYCAGRYDRARRRFAPPGCGYSGRSDA